MTYGDCDTCGGRGCPVCDGYGDWPITLVRPVRRVAPGIVGARVEGARSTTRPLA